MAAEDYAILVGISRYPNPGFAALEGPRNDVELMRQWLLSPSGGNMPDERIKIIESSKYDPPVDPFRAQPTSADFEEEYLRLERERMPMKAARVKGRLYLYFSGHGFCGREINRDAEAALYAANAAKDYYPHIYGTYFARRAKAKALFEEIVLIMDCCRDSEINRMPTQPAMPNTPDDEVSADVRVLAIYAVPRGGKAHERAIVERDGKVHGLLTHAMMKTFAEAKPSAPTQINATRLRDHLLDSWDAVCGPEAAPRPDVYLPTREMFFVAQNAGVSLTFTYAAPPAPGAMLVLRDGKLRRIAQFALGPSSDDDIIAADAPILSVDHQPDGLLLRVLPEYYQYELTGAVSRKDAIKVQGGEINVVL